MRAPWIWTKVLGGLKALGSSDQDKGIGTRDFGPDADADGHVPATDVTARANAAVAAELPLADTAEFEDARRGFLATDDPLVTRTPSGQLIWDRPSYDFIDGDAPPSVNPSLWRQAKLNNIHGLFQVTDRIYQVRGYDLANMSVIEGESGRILVDPLTSMETERLHR